MRADTDSAVLSPASLVDSSQRLLGWRLPAHAPQSPEEWRELADQFVRTRIRWSLLERYVSFSKRGYTRIVLGEDEHWSVLLLGWLPGQASPVHGHGASAGMTKVLLGQLEENTFALDHRELVPDRQRTARESQVIVEGHQMIHRVHNEAEQPALSLHLYAPPLAELVDYSGLPVRAERVAAREHPLV